MKFFITILISVITVAPTFACQIGWRSVAELEQEAEMVVLAKIVSAKHVSSSFRGEDYEYKINVEKTERGKIEKAQIITRYEDLKAQLRGQTRICPLKNGSGIEHDLKPGQRYKLYLKSSNEPEILLASPIKD